MGKASRDKGKAGEREFANFLKDRGFMARRGVQHKGGPDSPDIECTDLPVHFEVKRTERLELWKSLNQAIDESPGDKIPVVAHRPSRKDWIIILKADDFVDILKGNY